MRTRLLLAVVCVAIVAAACTHASTPSTTPPPPSTSPPPSGEPAAMIIPMGGTDFATLRDVPLLGDTPAYAGPATPHALDGVDYSSRLDPLLTPDVRAQLARDGFVIVPGDRKLFFEIYDEIPNSVFGAPGTVYVTTDVAYHYWHLVYDKVLRTLEEDVFLPKLEQLASAMLASATEQADAMRGTPMADEASRVAQLAQVEATVLGLPVASMGPLATKELALIRQHAQLTTSPITGARTDYSLYTPRGHYTRSAALTRYFVAMSLLGQTAFAFPSDQSPADEAAVARGALMAARLVTKAGGATPETINLWRDLYEATAFLVGAADDYTPAEMVTATDAVKAGSSTKPQRLTDADMRAIVDELLASRDVRIDPENPSMRLMGVRFTLDSWVLDQLIYPNVGTDATPRLFPSPLDLASAFKSPLAARIQHDDEQDRYKHYGSQMAKMRTAVAQVPIEGWGSSVYSAWLWAISPMFVPHGAAFPDTMQTPTWSAKALQTGFGSYAELKHDNILYVKQAGAEGAGPGPEYVIRNWVEPDPVVYERLAAVDDLMHTGLADRGLLSEEAKGLLVDLAKLYDFWATIATDELAAQPISDQDNARLNETGSVLEALWVRTSDMGRYQGGSANITDDESAIVADIARGGDQVVEVATGRIDTILVIVPDDRGGFQIAIGAAYSYYEFLQPASNRLTDEAWRAMLAQGSQPDRPAWEDVFLAG
jgi:hypothetical protein